jgi:DNA-binding IclR family transcriptional regulator
VREQTVPLIKTVSPFIDRIAEQTRELVHASLPQSKGMSTLYQRDGGIGGTRVGLDDSEVLPFHATSSGLAYLAFSDPALRGKVLARSLKKFTKQTPLSTDQLEAKITSTNACGYAFSDQFYEDEVCSVALPFFGTESRPIGTLAVAFPATRMTDDLRLTTARCLADASVDLTKDLGGKLPADLAETWQRL